MNELKLDIHALKEWPCFEGRPFIIAGPCSAESELQLMETGRMLAREKCVKVFRAGLWKPRSRPDSFAGVGDKGLAWMKNVKAETGLFTCVEVASPEHVEKSMKADIDILWIGARTTVNPFSVQEIAEALKGAEIPVLVKNPVNPDIGLWFGALERINKAGIQKLMAVHRGFFTYNSSPYRNAPIWELPIELMRLCPDLPIICDPSHIAGNTILLESISQKALDLEMDGLMIETHHDPIHALSDKEQQITPAELDKLISNLIIRSFDHKSATFKNTLEKLRSEIDVIDAELIQLLSKRMCVVEKIGNHKKENNITILQLKRWKEIIRERVVHGKNLNLNREFLLKLLRVIHEESIRKQTEIFGNKELNQVK